MDSQDTCDYSTKSSWLLLTLPITYKCRSGASWYTTALVGEGREAQKLTVVVSWEINVNSSVISKVGLVTVPPSLDLRRPPTSETTRGGITKSVVTPKGVLWETVLLHDFLQDRSVHKFLDGGFSWGPEHLVPTPSDRVVPPPFPFCQVFHHSEVRDLLSRGNLYT